MLNNGGGDFSTFITGNDDFAFVGFPYAPGDPSTSALDTLFRRIPPQADARKEGEVACRSKPHD
jgi:hypothetical protein